MHARPLRHRQVAVAASPCLAAALAVAADASGAGAEPATAADFLAVSSCYTTDTGFPDLAGLTGRTPRRRVVDRDRPARRYPPRGAKPGRFAVTSVRLRDKADHVFGHVRDPAISRPEAERLGATVTVLSNQDRQAPRLRWLRTSTPTVDVTRRAAYIAVRAPG